MSVDEMTSSGMERDRVDCGFIPLVDCAPLVVAHEMGFAEEESYDLVLHREPSWSSIRDKLALGRLTAAHML
ncbi:MAG: ABC transporter substrate-binding protein, partial [Pseudomonadota bacterium]